MSGYSVGLSEFASCRSYLFQAVNQAVLTGTLVPPQLTVKDFYMTGGSLVLWYSSH